MIFAHHNFLAIKGGVSELVDPLSQDSHGAAIIETHLASQVHVPKHVVPHLGVSGSMLIVEDLQALAALLTQPLLIVMVTRDAVLLRPSSGNGIGPARMDAGI